MTQKCVPGTEATSDALAQIISKALAYPRRGVEIGSGRHVSMQETWDGFGPTPPGWTRQPTITFLRSAIDAQLPISDELAAALQDPVAQSLLTAQEQVTLNAALATRVAIDLDDAVYIGKFDTIAAAPIPEEPMSLTTKVAIGAGAMAVAAGLAELAHLAGLF